MDRPTAPRRRRMDDTRVVQIGTALWAAAFVAMLPFAGRLRASGRLWWLGTCAAGFVLGLVGLAYLRRREAAISRAEDRSDRTDRVAR